MSSHFRKSPKVFPIENHKVTTPQIQGTDSAGTHDYVNLEADYTPQHLQKNGTWLRKRCTKFWHELILWKNTHSAMFCVKHLHVDNRTTRRYILPTPCIVLAAKKFVTRPAYVFGLKCVLSTCSPTKIKIERMIISIISAKGSFVPLYRPSSSQDLPWNHEVPYLRPLFSTICQSLLAAVFALPWPWPKERALGPNKETG